MNLLLKYLEGSSEAFVMVLGGLICLLSWQVWLTSVAFAEKWWWAYVVFLLAPVGPVLFATFYWQKTKPSFLIGLVGFILGVGIFLGRTFVTIDMCGPDYQC